LHGTALTAHSQLLRKSETLHPGGQQAKSVEQRSERLLPHFRDLYGSEQRRKAVKRVLREIENAFDFPLCGKEPEKEPGEFRFFPGGWKDDAEEPVDRFGHQASVIGQAGFDKEREGIGFVKDGRDAGVVTVTYFRRRLENGKPNAFPPPLGARPSARTKFRAEFGDSGVAMAEPVEQLHESIKPGPEGARARKSLGAIRESAQGRIALLLCREQRENQVTGRFHGSHRKTTEKPPEVDFFSWCMVAVPRDLRQSPGREDADLSPLFSIFPTKRDLL